MAEQSMRIVEAKNMGFMTRLFGSVGIDGDGTEFELAHVDPFIMCDHVDKPISKDEAPMRPPFCAHPHTGNAVASLLIEGEDMTAWDNIHGFEKEKLSAGGVYVVCTGQGCVHDEAPDVVAVERVFRRTQFGNAGDERPGGRFRFFQLWFDPGHVHAEGGPPPVSTCVVRPEAVPMLSGGAMKIRVLIGNYNDLCAVPNPVTVLHCALLPFSGHGVLSIPSNQSGFIFSIERKVRIVAGTQTFELPAKQELLLPAQPEPYELRVDVEMEGDAPGDAKADDALEILVGFGPPICKPFYKLLGYGGALIASSEEKVRLLMKQYEQDPKNFGVPKDVIPPDTSCYGLQSGYKDPLDGKGECQRDDAAAKAPEARFFRVENGPYQPKGKGKGK